MTEIDLGNLIDDVFNSEEVKLGFIDGSDTKFFSALQDITENWERLESKIETRVGTKYIFSKNHNNFVEFKMAVTRNEIALLHGFQSSLVENTWVIKGTDESGTSTGATLSFTGKLPVIKKQNAVPGGYIMTCRIRVTQQNVLVT